MNMVPFSGSAQLNGQGAARPEGRGVKSGTPRFADGVSGSLGGAQSAQNYFRPGWEPLLIHEQMPAVQRTERVAQLLQQVGLPAEAMRRYPHQFSGGQRQRICTPALALNPKVIIADESVSALDVSVQAQVLTLLEDLRQRYRLSYLFISHDMAVVERICHRVAVMFGGQLCGDRPTRSSVAPSAASLYSALAQRRSYT